MGKEFEIQGRICNLPSEMTEEEFWRKMIGFIEEYGWSFGGGLEKDKISGCVSETSPDMTRDEFEKAFLGVIERNGWTFEGSISIYKVLLFKNASFYDGKDTTIQGENFRALMDLCFSHADKFSLRRCGWPGEHDGALEQALRPFCVGEYLSYSTRTWFEKEHREKCYLYLATEETKNILLRHIHHLFGTEESLAPDGYEKYLQEKYAAYHQAEVKATEQVTAYMDHMGQDRSDDDMNAFTKEAYREARELWLHIFDETDYYSTMEDPCFFCGDKMFLEVVTHESDCFAHAFSETFSEKLEELGEWVDATEDTPLPLFSLEGAEGVELYKK